MPWAVKACGRRGAIGGEGFLLANWVTQSSLVEGLCAGFTSPRPAKGGERESNRVRCLISALVSGLPDALPQCNSPGVVAADLVWLGFSPLPGKALMLFNSYPFIFL